MSTRVFFRLLAACILLAMLGGNLVAAAAPPSVAPETSTPRARPTVPEQAAPVCGGSLATSADTYVNSLLPETLYGAARSLAIGLPAGATEYALLGFNVSGFSALDVTVQHAELQLTLTAAPNPQPFGLEIHEITGTWSEATTRWYNRPLLGAGYGSAGYNADGNVMRIDVTELVAHWFSSAVSPTVSLAVVPRAAGSLMTAFSREGATGGAGAPHLVIDCSAAPEEDKAGEAARDQRQQGGIARLKQQSTKPAKLELSQGAITFADFAIPLPPDAGGDPPARAQWFLRAYSDTLRLTNPGDELQLLRHSGDGQHIFYRQQRNGIPVYGAVVGVHFGDGSVRNFQGNYVPDASLPSVPRLSAGQAEDLTMRALLGDGSVRLGDGSVRTRSGAIRRALTGDTQLRYLNPSLLGRSDRRTHLAWQVELQSGRGVPVTMFIDAFTGQVLLKQSHSSEEFELEYLYNADHDTTSACWVWTNSDEWFDENGVLPGTNPDSEGYTAFNNIKTVYNYWRNRFGRDSYDSDGEEIEAYIHVGNAWRNAHYIGGICDIFEFGEGYPKLDVVGHEFTHAVDYSEGDLDYENQSGALDESFADIFGYFVDPSNWTMGEGVPNGPLRSLKTPPTYGDPDHMLKSKSGDGQGLRPFEEDPECDKDEPGYNDCGWVHVNSGIHNKVAYLLIAGDTHNGRVITAIGKTKAERLFYNVLTSWMWGSAKFIDARNAAVAEAGMLWLQNKLTLNDVCQVRNAYASVGLGSGDADCDGIEDAIETDNDNDGVPDSKDNCMYVANSGQGDADKDGIGNACETDADNDGKPNGQDNCPLAANPYQGDIDGDGKGDVCDDSDGDTIVDAKDNCRTTPNYDQKDTDHDGKGNECDTDWDNDGDANPVDNCPLVFNPNQADDDLDEIGNSCDLCPSVSSPDNGDADGDGLGNACDADADNDGVPNGSDNCRYVPNANQFDLDQNHIGTACDPGEQWPGKINSKVLIDVLTRIPLPDCIGCSTHYTPGGLETRLNVALPVGFQARVVDSSGRQMTKGRQAAGGYLALRFPLADIAQRPPLPTNAPANAADSLPDNSTRYYLEIVKDPASSATGEVTITADVTETARNGIYLPALRR